MRRFALILSVLLAVGAAGVALSPYWLGAMLPAIARRFDATIGTYSRSGYGRFVLGDVRVDKPGVTVRVRRVEADTPWLWAGRHLFGHDREIVATEWQVEVHPVPNRPRPAQPSGWMPLREQLLRIGAVLERWLPRARVGAGRISWPGNALEVAAVDWRDRTARVEGLRWREHSASGAVELGREPGRLRVDATLRERPVRLEATSDDDAVKGSVVAWNQKAPFSAQFEPTGWLPRNAAVEAERWKLTGAEVGLARYESLAGDVRASWATDHFAVQARVNGAPAAGGAPPLRIEASASGNRSAYTIERLHLESPGVTADLSAPVRVAYGADRADLRSRFQFAADLGTLPGVRAKGRITGTLDVEPGPDRWPRLRFDAAGNQLVSTGWTLRTARLRGALDWPRLEVETFEADAEPQGRLTGSATADLAKRELAELRLEGRVPYDLVQRLLPAGVVFGAADVVLRASGPFATAAHEGTVVVSGLRVRGLQPAAARLWWRGAGRQVNEFDAGIHAGTTEFLASGALQPDRCELRKLVWRHEGADRLTLQHPAVVRWKPRLGVDAFDLVGPAGELRLTADWGDAGRVRFFARGIAAEWWHDFLPPTPFEWSIDRFSLQADWDHGPAKADLSGLVSLKLRDGRLVALDLAAKSDGQAVLVDHLRATEAGKDFATLHGRLPLSLTVAPRFSFALPDGDLAVDGAVSPDADWWNEIARRGGVRLVRPDLTLHLAGSWRRPEGRAELKLAEVDFPEGKGAPRRPRIQDVHAVLLAEKDRVRLEPVEARVEGQAVSAAASLPADPELWRRLWEDARGVILDHGEVRLRASHAEIAALAPYFPSVLLPQGQVDLDLSLSARGPWSGHISLSGAGTRPLGALGPLRDIQAQITAENRTLKLERVEAAFGGKPVTVTGTIEIPPGRLPRYDLSVTGEALPFVRQEGLLVRGNVALKLASDAQGGPPLISGEVVLRDSLFLSDVRALVPNGQGSGPERRPPYFAVPQEPFNHWRLDVKLAGQRFLRARTTVFNGTASMKFSLLGTLGDPRAVGEVRIDEGQVLFPFARFDLGDASVRLTEENPYDPQLGVFGTSRRYGYDLKLELTGPASAPNLVFTSNPPLTSEQVLLLVMAGETPKNEVNYSTSQRFARLGTYFGQSLLGSLSGGEGGDRLTINSGERISRQGRETYDVEYALDRRWTLVGEYDEFDEYNIGLKRRILPRKDRNEEADEKH